jgi:hypothetical protein
LSAVLSAGEPKLAPPLVGRGGHPYRDPLRAEPAAAGPRGWLGPALFFAAGGALWGLAYFGGVGAGAVGALPVGALLELAGFALAMLGAIFGAAIYTARSGGRGAPSRDDGLLSPSGAPMLRAAWVVLSLALIRAVSTLPLWGFGLLVAAWLALAGLAAAAEVEPSPEAARAWLWWAVKRALAIALTFHYVCFAWIFFRAVSFEKALGVLGAIGGLSLDAANLSTPFLYALMLGAAAHFFPPRTFAWLKTRFAEYIPPLLAALVGVGVAYALSLLASPDVVPFIYFQF